MSAICALQCNIQVDFRRTPIAASVACSAIFFCARPFVAQQWTVGFKTASIAALALAVFRLAPLAGAGLAVSSLGDFFLGLPQIGPLHKDGLFMFGLSSFLVAHLCYIAFFAWRASVHRAPHPARLAGIALIVVIIASMLAFIGSRLGPMLVPVLLYASVIGVMGVTAMLAKLGNSLAAIGALLFIASDAMLAIGKFREPFPAGDQLVWIAYYAGQFLMARAFLAKSRYSE